MNPLKQALILCAGKALRLRPFSYSLSKSQLPFLNLPLLAYPWKLAEELQNSSFLLNSHLFPDELKKTAKSLSKKDQKVKTFFEEEPLSSPGTLYALKKELQKTSYFTYINGDCLLFPSHPQRLLEFEREFLNSKAEALLFVIPVKPNFKFFRKEKNRFLYCDSNQNLIEATLPKKNQKKPAYFFTGLALFKSSLLDDLKAGARDLFDDFLQPLATHKKIKVFIDEGAFFLEAGNKESYLKSTEFCLKSLYEVALFYKKTSFVRERLKEIFNHFDPKDKKTGFKNGSLWSKKLKALVLAPESVKGLDFLKTKGFSVIAPQVRFYDKTEIENSVIARSHFSLKGQLKKELIV